MVSNVVMTEFTSSAVVVFVMNRLKDAKWFPLIQDGRVWLNRAISVVAAALTALAVGYTWEPTTRQLILTIPTLPVVAAGLWHWLNQYALNETIYQATAGKTTNGAASAPAPAKI